MTSRRCNQSGFGFLSSVDGVRKQHMPCCHVQTLRMVVGGSAVNLLMRRQIEAGHLGSKKPAILLE